MTKEEQINAAVESMVAINSTTSVKGWTFKFADKFYTVICFWMTPIGNHVAVFESNKKGKRNSGAKDLVLLKNCKDPVLGIEALADILVIEEMEHLRDPNLIGGLTMPREK